MAWNWILYLAVIEQSLSDITKVVLDFLCWTYLKDQHFRIYYVVRWADILFVVKDSCHTVYQYGPTIYVGKHPSYVVSKVTEILMTAINSVTL